MEKGYNFGAYLHSSQIILSHLLYGKLMAFGKSDRKTTRGRLATLINF
jgi:hypothetical protein